jgi:superfamily II DNA or RNA helicase
MFGAADAVEYPIYRESSNKIYLPRFYGKSVFGEVKRMAIHPGDDIAIEFAGGLRPIQVPVVEAYLNAVQDSTSGDGFGGGGLLELPCAFGKTVLSLNIIARLKKKTLVIVNKEFLLNQWVERIAQFLPEAKVGRIQGPEIDIDGKDIVIGMLQSISQKDYDAAVFSSFGLTIIDEVHHISSEVFSRALFKIVSKYMLGLSATMERKDGTTYVFKQFLGEVAFKGERDGGEHDVEVRAIEYVSKDAEFNKVECDFRGNPKYSTMIVKLCDHCDRSDFIVRVIGDLIKEQPGAQIMILAHNRSILTYLHDSIIGRGIATAGYYVGGMREASLKETEDKQVVVATYAMAAEALDIKTLNTLVMVTPKTDIVQSVGRILREKHDKPLVVDIVDGHDVFKNQWAKRRRYYKKCEYTIRSINSFQYSGFENMDKWKTVYKSTNVVCKSDSDDGEEDPDPKRKMGPNKCMVVLDETDDA